MVSKERYILLVQHYASVLGMFHNDKETCGHCVMEAIRNHQLFDNWNLIEMSEYSEHHKRKMFYDIVAAYEAMYGEPIRYYVTRPKCAANKDNYIIPEFRPLIAAGRFKIKLQLEPYNPISIISFSSQ